MYMLIHICIHKYMVQTKYTQCYMCVKFDVFSVVFLLSNCNKFIRCNLLIFFVWNQRSKFKMKFMLLCVTHLKQLYSILFHILILFVFQSIPTDDRHDSWNRAISSHANPPYKGFICDKHFCDDDLTKGKVRNLKKDAVPKIFEPSDCTEIPQNDNDHEHIAEIEPNVQIDLPDLPDLHKENELTDENLQYRQLYLQFINEKAEWNVQEEKLNHKIKKLENNVEEQKQHIKFLNLKLNRETKSKESLNKLLEDLHAQKLLKKENLAALKASIFISFILVLL